MSEDVEQTSKHVYKVIVTDPRPPEIQEAGAAEASSAKMHRTADEHRRKEYCRVHLTLLS